MISQSHPTDIVFIVLATYNRGEKCTSVIENILDQNISNWYLLIVDDGSENMHSDCITDFLDKNNDSRVHYIKNSKNLKLSSTLNVGIDKFLEDKDYSYFTWVSDDNYYSPNYIKNLYDLKADFAHSAWIRGNHVAQTQYVSYDDIRRNFRGLASYMWSRKAMQKIGKYNLDYPLVSDLEFLYKTFYFIKDNIKYSPVSEMTYIIHNDADSIKYSGRLSIEDRHLKENFETYIHLLSNK